MGEHILLSLASSSVLNRLKSEPSQGQKDTKWKQATEMITAVIGMRQQQPTQECRRNSNNIILKSDRRKSPTEIKRIEKKQKELMKKDCQMKEGSSQRKTSGVFGAQTHRATAVHYKRVWGREKRKEQWLKLNQSWTLHLAGITMKTASR